MTIFRGTTVYKARQKYDSIRLSHTGKRDVKIGNMIRKDYQTVVTGEIFHASLARLSRLHKAFRHGMRETEKENVMSLNVLKCP